jgi:L-lysine exporter family protein LysE/ArgO
MLVAGVTGFITGFTLILAIGPQNAFVLRQGLLQAHVTWICLLCAISDAALIVLGVVGASWISAVVPFALELLRWGGAVYLIIYGAIKFGIAFQPGTLTAAGIETGSLRAALITCLALTWLNPHVYLDTVGLIGAVSAHFPVTADKIAYAVGAVLASFIFFFALGHGARLLAPFFALPGTWRLLDLGIALVMWAIAAKLVLEM